jgi:hypothetical protein
MMFCFLLYFLLKSTNQSKPEDIDVSQERERIENNEAGLDVLVVKNLTKRYRHEYNNS